MIRLLIWGSCVTRDCFAEDVCGHDCTAMYEIDKYFARSSLVSQLSQPVLLKGEIQLSSSFQRRMIADDFEKRFFLYLEKVKQDIDYLLIDFIEERFDIIALSDSYVTYSGELATSGFLKNYSYNKIDRANLDELYFKYLSLFFKEILKHLPAEKIVVHKVFFVSEYLVNGKVKKMPCSRNTARLLNSVLVCKKIFGKKYYKIASSDLVNEFNRRLEKTYAYISCTHPYIKIIEADKSNCLASPFHKWGMAPMHFISDYYRDIFLKIDKICHNSL